MPEPRRVEEERDPRADATFKRHGPEPPENDSGPSPGADETVRDRPFDHPAERETGQGQQG